jgi:hypothetical protein
MDNSAIPDRNSIEISGKSILEYDKQQASRIQTHFIDVMDYLLDDYEDRLSQIYRKKEIMASVSGQDQSAIEVLNLEVSIKLT